MIRYDKILYDIKWYDMILYGIYKLQLGWHPVAVEQYNTFTHKQYTEYRERNIRNDQIIKHS
jgi:hypothetical protein